MRGTGLKVLLGLLLIGSSFGHGWAQKGHIPQRPNMDLFQYANSILLTEGYEAAIDSLLQQAPNFTSDSASMLDKGTFYQAAMTYASFAGLNQLALEFELKAFGKRKSEPAKLDGSAKVVPAVAYIVEQYGQEPVIMFNEAHSRGQNRAFFRSLLPQLYEKGFRCLAIETLDYGDTMLQQRGYPLQNTGFYTREAAFGQLIREAIALGFEILPYEDTARVEPDNRPFPERANAREKAQAEHLSTYLKKHPGAKMVVLAGHDHIHKTSRDEWIKMGERLCKLLGRDIPSIDCTVMQEKHETSREHPVYQAVQDSFQIRLPVVLLQNDTAFYWANTPGAVDVCVIMPRTNYDYGYPDWMKNSYTSHALIAIPSKTDYSGRLLHIYREEEWVKHGKQAIPVMHIDLKPGTEMLDLYLQKGQYRAIIGQGSEKPLFNKSFYAN
jgi:hypothetical protein